MRGSSADLGLGTPGLFAAPLLQGLGVLVIFCEQTTGCQRARDLLSSKFKAGADRQGCNTRNTRAPSPVIRSLRPPPRGAWGYLSEEQLGTVGSSTL